ncbi:MAG: S8 family peptidase [bacterium]
MNTARKDVKADSAQKLGYSGKNIGIAFLDTGISNSNDFTKPINRIIAFKDFINNKKFPYDDNGHGTHVAGIACGSGINSNGVYKGIAINSNIIGVKVLNSEGQGNASDVLAGIQWVLDNKKKYNIKIMNLSIGTNNTSTNDPLVKAVEKAWDLGLIVNIAAGNNGPDKSSISSPAISKKIITVGSSDDDKKTNVLGNNLVNFSGRGPTLECVIKPDIVAPGVDIISCSNNINNFNNFSILNILSVSRNNYIALSGTSMSTPIVSGAVALLLEKYPTLEPNDVKLMLKKSCKNLSLPRNQQGWGLLDIYKLLSMEVSYGK